MPTKPLPAHPNLQHLKMQARDLVKSHRARTADASQRIREFHPRFRGASDAAIGGAAFALSDAQLAIAREYGFASWPKLKAHVDNPQRDDLALPHYERIKDAVFRRAVDLLDAGDVAGLRAYLERHPAVVRQRVTFEGGNYFGNPTLLEFVAENPTRRGKLPRNIVETARVILDLGGKEDRSSLDSALELVASSSIARECGVQDALIDLLCGYGADPNAGVLAPLMYGEFDGTKALLRRGARLDLATAAALGLYEDAHRLLPLANDEMRQMALALASQHGRIDIVGLLLDAGADPNRYSPVGGHSHATPLHQAALAGHADVVRLLVERGARSDVQDVHRHLTPAQWAEYAGHTELAKELHDPS